MNNKNNLNLSIGAPKDGKKIIINEKNRFLNLAVIGTKNTGKTTKVMSSFAKQMIKDGTNEAGCTFIVNGKDEAFYIYSIAQRLKKKSQIRMFKPSVDINTYRAIVENDKYDYDKMANLIDYKKEIRDKSIIIIDVEEILYCDKSELLLKKILHHLFIDIQNTKETLNRPHYLFIDDADGYLDILKELLIYGEEYNLALTLFLNSVSELSERNQFLIKNTIKNYIILSDVSYEDAVYFSNRIKPLTDIENQTKNLIEIMSMQKGFVFYNIVNENNHYEYGKCKFISEIITDDEDDSIMKNAKKIKKKLAIPDNNIPIKISTDDFNKKYYKEITTKKSKEIFKEINDLDNQNTNTNYEEKATNVVADAILENVKNTSELYRTEKQEFDLNKIIENTVPKNTEDIKPIEDDEPVLKKKKKKKKKKKHNNNQEISSGLEVNPLTELIPITNDFNEVKDNDNSSEIGSEITKESNIKEPVIDTLPVTQEETPIINTSKEIEKTEDIIGDIVEEVAFNPEIEETYSFDINDDTDGDEMIISLQNVPEVIKPKTIDEDLQDTIEIISEKEINETIPIENNVDNNLNKTFFDINSLFDDEDE